MPKTLRIARRFLTFGLAIYWLLIALGTHLPSRATGAQWVNDKVLHFVAFFGLSFLLSWCFLHRQLTARRAVVILLITLIYGVIDEVTQAWVPTRHADLYDWLADSCGAVVGMAFYYASLRMVSRWSPQTVQSWSSTLPIEPQAGIVVTPIEPEPTPERERRKDAA